MGVRGLDDNRDVVKLNPSGSELVAREKRNGEVVQGSESNGRAWIGREEMWSSRDSKEVMVQFS